MKSYFTNYDDLAVAWATGDCKPYSYTAKKRMFTEHDRIYSYGAHFCIARKFLDFVLITERTYSPTTRTHIEAVSSAVRDSRLIPLPSVDVIPSDYSLTDLKNTVMENECAKLDEAIKKYLRTVRPWSRDLWTFEAAEKTLAKLGMQLPSEYDHKRYLIGEHYDRRSERNIVLRAKLRLVGKL